MVIDFANLGFFGIGILEKVSGNSDFQEDFSYVSKSDISRKNPRKNQLNSWNSSWCFLPETRIYYLINILEH